MKQLLYLIIAALTMTSRAFPSRQHSTSGARLLTQTESAREFPAILRGLLEMLLRFPTRVSLKRVACGAKIASFLAKNASFPQ
jgi:hypothetical protein